ncbi:hypothetical protein ACFL6C_14110 [Myxococcota bacterium]
MAVDLSKEPISFSLIEDENTGFISFSDMPEQLIPTLVEAYGAPAVAQVIQPSEVEIDFIESFDESERARPRYMELLENGELERRVRGLDEQGFVPKTVPYFMAAINRSDEAMLGRTGGIYFVCPKGCLFCQYRDFDEATVTVEGIAERMLALQEAGADNIQWISPTTHTRALAKALLIAAKEGLRIPIVHKSEGEDSLADLGLLAGAVDVYVPDIKFINPEFAQYIGLGKNYPKRMKVCIREMYRQVGRLKRRPGTHLEAGGMMVRHLIMPGGVEEGRDILTFLREIDRFIPVHFMCTYEPLHDATGHPEIGRSVTDEEIHEVALAGRKRLMRSVYVR